MKLEKKDPILRVENIDASVIQRIGQIRSELKAKRGKIDDEVISLETELNEVFNQLSDGEYLKPENATHVMNANFYINNDPIDIEKDFDPKKLFENQDGSSHFFYSVSGNVYLKYEGCNILIIFSPKNLFLKKILRMYLIKCWREMSVWPEEAERIRLFLKGEDQPVTGRTTYDWGKIIFTAVKRNVFREVKWREIASCIVDLNVGKVYRIEN